MTSSTTHLNILRDRGKGLKPTGRICVDDLLEFIATHLREATIAYVLFELRIGPGVRGDQEELFGV